MQKSIPLQVVDLVLDYLDIEEVIQIHDHVKDNLIVSDLIMRKLFTEISIISPFVSHVSEKLFFDNNEIYIYWYEDTFEEFAIEQYHPQGALAMSPYRLITDSRILKYIQYIQIETFQLSKLDVIAISKFIQTLPNVKGCLFQGTGGGFPFFPVINDQIKYVKSFINTLRHFECKNSSHLYIQSSIPPVMLPNENDEEDIELRENKRDIMCFRLRQSIFKNGLDFTPYHYFHHLTWLSLYMVTNNFQGQHLIELKQLQYLELRGVYASISGLNDHNFPQLKEFKVKYVINEDGIETMNQIIQHSVKVFKDEEIILSQLEVMEIESHIINYLPDKLIAPKLQSLKLINVSVDDKSGYEHFNGFQMLTL